LVQILVNEWLVPDAFGPVGEFQRRQRLKESLRRGRNHGEHGGLAVASQTVTQQSSQHRVSVGNVAVGLAFSESANHHAQTTQTHIDVLALLQTLP
jgi:hypothetical protein